MILPISNVPIFPFRRVIWIRAHASGRIARPDLIRRHVSGDYSPGADDRAVSDHHAFEKEGVEFEENLVKTDLEFPSWSNGVPLRQKIELFHPRLNCGMIHEIS